MTHDDKIGILIELCNAINEHAPLDFAQGLRTAVEYPAYIGISFDGVTNDDGELMEISLGFADDSRGVVFSWNCLQDNALSGVIDVVNPTYDGVAKLFWGQLFSNMLNLVAINVLGA
jgi:hypothetical protein